MLACGLTAGCGSSRSGLKFTPETLPANLMAAKRENARTLDLSRLAGTATNSELIHRGDVVDVTIATGLREKENLTQPVRVRDDGIADIPIVGPVQLAGLELAEAEAVISEACIQRQLYRNPHITVTMRRQRVNRVTVVGAVQAPGLKDIPRAQCDLLSALVAAGGLSDDAGTIVEIRNPVRDVPPPEPIAADDPEGVRITGHSRPGVFTSTTSGERRQSLRVDLISATRNGLGDLSIDDGAVVMVEKRDPEPVHVLGLVVKPNRYEFPIGQDLRVLDAIALAGGVSSPVASKVFVIRKLPNSSETFITELKISDAKRRERNNLLLAPGDVVSVEQTPMTVFVDTLRLINFGLGASLPLTTLF
jgi:polysaccharide export outer membrane protein